MYQFVNSLCLGRNTGSQWQEIDISNFLVKDIYANFSKIYLTLSNNSLPNNVYIDMTILKAEFSNYNNTLNQLLIYLDNRTLVTIPELPNSNVKYVKYSDAVRARYKITLTKVGINTPDNYPISDLTDIELSRPSFDTNIELLHKYCLISVNGYIHNTDYSNDKAYVYDAGKTLNKSRNNHIGILSFLDIGELTKIRIQEANIHAETETDFLKNKIYFSVNADLDNKSYILVLGGYLVFPSENVFWRNSDNSFVLDLNQLQYIERIYESSQYLDLSSLNLTTIPVNENMINLEELWSDEVIKKYLTLSQSFLVTVNVNTILTNKINLKTSNVPGMFTSYTDPTYPLIVNYGKVAEYWKTHEDGHWSVSIMDNFAKNYILSEQPHYQLENVTNSLVPYKPYELSRGFLLEIAGYNF